MVDTDTETRHRRAVLERRVINGALSLLVEDREHTEMMINLIGPGVMEGEDWINWAGFVQRVEDLNTFETNLKLARSATLSGAVIEAAWSWLEEAMVGDCPDLRAALFSLDEERYVNTVGG